MKIVKFIKLILQKLILTIFPFLILFSGFFHSNDSHKEDGDKGHSKKKNDDKNKSDSSEEHEHSHDEDEGEHSSIIMATSGINTEIIQLNILKEILFSRKINSEILIMLQDISLVSLSRENIDMTFSCRATNSVRLLDNIKDTVCELEPCYDGLKTGIAVPDYFKLYSIDHIMDHYELPLLTLQHGVGIAQETVSMIESMGFGDNILIKYHTNYYSMLNSMVDLIEQRKNFLITLWKPNWLFKEYNLRFLNDFNNYFGKHQIKILTKYNLQKTNKFAYNLFKNYKLDHEEYNELLTYQSLGYKPESIAKQFIKNNPKIIKKWLND